MNFNTRVITMGAAALMAVRSGESVEITPELAKSLAPVELPVRAKIARHIRRLERTQPAMSEKARELLAVKIATGGGNRARKFVTGGAR